MWWKSVLQFSTCARDLKYKFARKHRQFVGLRRRLARQAAKVSEKENPRIRERVCVCVYVFEVLVFECDSVRYVWICVSAMEQKYER